MKNTKSAEIDFDLWADMARNDPEAFETMRLEAIDAVIARAPQENQERLRRLQWRIDQERRLARTPMAACLRISRMMWRSVLGPGGLNERFAELQKQYHGRIDESVAPQPLAGQVVAFGRPRD
jgi:hypothetical protein